MSDLEGSSPIDGASPPGDRAGDQGRDSSNGGIAESPDHETPGAFGDAEREGEATSKPASRAPTTHRPDYRFLIAVSAVSLILDLGSKWWAIEKLQPSPEQPVGRIVVIEGLLQFVYAQNRGGAWGVLQDQHDWLRIPFFLLISVVAIVFILSMYRKLAPDQWALKWGLPLVLGGAAGNLVDRLRYGHVIDFIDVFVQIDGKTQHWPTFNVADIAIVVGVILMGIDMFTSRKATPAKAPARAEE